MEQDQARILMTHRQQEMLERFRRNSGGTPVPNGPPTPIPSTTPQAPTPEGQNLSQETILKEITATLSHRKKLHTQVSRLENEVNCLEKQSDSKPVPVIHNGPAKQHHHEKPPAPMASPQPVIMSSPHHLPSPAPPPPPPPQTHHTKGRKGRESRTRSQEWPDIPDIGKIEEQNPEILAQKILETGRQIEAGKIRDAPKHSSHRHSDDFKNESHASHSKSLPTSPTKSSKSTSNRNNPVNSPRSQEPPKVPNFEDRLKSIITSVLNEDQNRRQGIATPNTPSTSAAPTANVYSPGSSSMPAPLGHSINHGYPVAQAAPVADLKARELKQHQRGGSENRRQPDYTQVSPAKLALRRHLSQEKLAQQMQQQQQEQRRNSSGNYARTIGDLVSGEIERTLEISNQSIINAAVDMSTHSAMRADALKVNDRITRIMEDTKKDEGALRTVYSPISRPSSAEGTPNNAPSIPSPQTLEGLAYPHRAKSPTASSPYGHHSYPQHGSSSSTPRPASQSSTQEFPHLYANSQHVSSSSSPYVPGATRVVENFPQDGHTVQLPRADIKPYHESYFTDNKPIVMATTSMAPSPAAAATSESNNYAPVEGLAASLHARIINKTPQDKPHGTSSPSTSEIKPKDEFENQGGCLMEPESGKIDECIIVEGISQLVKRERPSTPEEIQPMSPVELIPPPPPHHTKSIPRKRSSSAASSSPPSKVVAMEPEAGNPDNLRELGPTSNQQPHDEDGTYLSISIFNHSQ